MDGTQFVDITELLLDNNNKQQEAFLGESTGRLFIEEQQIDIGHRGDQYNTQQLQSQYTNSKNHINSTHNVIQSQKNLESDSQLSKRTRANESKTYLKQTLQKHQQEQQFQDMLRDSDLLDTTTQNPNNNHATGASEEILSYIKHKQNNINLPIYQQYYGNTAGQRQPIKAQQFLQNLNVFKDKDLRQKEQNRHLKQEQLNIFNPESQKYKGSYQFDDIYYKIKNKQQKQNGESTTKLQELKQQISDNIQNKYLKSQKDEGLVKQRQYNETNIDNQVNIRKQVQFSQQLDQNDFKKQSIYNQQNKYNSVNSYNAQSSQHVSTQNVQNNQNKQTTIYNSHAGQFASPIHNTLKQTVNTHQISQQKTINFEKTNLSSIQNKHDQVSQETLHYLLRTSTEELQKQLQINESNESIIQYFKEQIYVLNEKIKEFSTSLLEIDQNIIELRRGSQSNYSNRDEYGSGIDGNSVTEDEIDKIVALQVQYKRKLDVLARYVNRLANYIQ